MGEVRVRFAPSPTGLLHVGNARVALVNWLFAKAALGTFVLRLDDTDAERSEARFAAAIERDLTWLGLACDTRVRQSERMDDYRAQLERLKESGRAYACFETAEELEFKRRKSLRAGRPPIYDRAALGLGAAERDKLIAEGRRPHWRFKLDEGEIAWTDLVRGPQRFEAKNLSDPVVVRGDGAFLYMLPSVVDDVALKISHVIRGEDHVVNTAVQIRMFQALGADIPAFAHLPLLMDAKGENLSKRLGSLGLESLKDSGIEPMAVNSLLARLGTADAIGPVLRLADLVAGFELGRFGRASPRFDPNELFRLNAQLLHAMPFAEAAPRLKALGLTSADERFWHAIRSNLERFSDAKVWHDACFGDVPPPSDPAREFLRAAAGALPPEPWDDGTWGAWSRSVGEATGLKGAQLFRPLRLALTGREHGPEMKVLLPLIGRARAEKRLDVP
ncbi:MAG: glutamate--tRNA ligase [Rhodospirillales bacterium]|nr:glutamate--tRNA ligase [Rhodospirillales bacterium]MSP80677.1 glutamate--tRNA ligase [Rhodospirillales bacterium]